MTWAAITVCGFLGADPTIKTFDKGAIVCNFVLYVSRRKQDLELPPMKFHVEVWGKQAEICVNYLRKGSKPTLSGILEEETFTGKDGGSVTLKMIRSAQVIDFGPKSTNRESENISESETPKSEKTKTVSQSSRSKNRTKVKS